ncbi:MAG TPA: ATPase, partial [Cystobacter sp.]
MTTRSAIARSAPFAAWMEELDLLIRARYPLLYLVSWEEHRVESLLGEVARAHGKVLLTWSVRRGLRPVGSTRGPVLPEDTRNPLEALAAIEKLSEPALVVLEDFPPYLEEKPLVRALRELAQSLKSTFTTVVLLSPTLQLPAELEKEVSVLDVPLPGFEELTQLLK